MTESSRIIELESALDKALNMLASVEAGKTYTTADWYVAIMLLEVVRNPTHGDTAAIHTYSRRAMQ